MRANIFPAFCLTRTCFIVLCLKPIDVSGFLHDIDYVCVLLLKILAELTELTALGFQRLRNGQGPQPRHIPKYENNMNKI